MSTGARKSRTDILGIHRVFRTLYAFAAIPFLVGAIVCVNFEIIFQSGLGSFTVGIAFLMFSTLIIGKEICLTRGEFYIIGRHIWSIIFAAAFSIAYLAFYIWNIVNILLLCPKPHPHHNRTDVTLVTAHTESLMSIASIDKATEVTSLTEDQAFQLARAAKICRNEQGFAMAMLIFLIVVVILNFITIWVYLWLKGKLKRVCLPLPVIQHC